MESLPKLIPAKGAQSISNKASPSPTLANVVRHFAVDSGSTLFATAVMTVLIFGGCCSNVRATSRYLHLPLVRRINSLVRRYTP